jgi:hypothetical protein
MTHLTRLFLLFALAACVSTAAYAVDTGDIVVTSIKGEVVLTVQGAARTLKAGGVLDTPSTIRTGHDGAIELKQGATRVSVGPDSLLEFPAQEKRGGAIDRIVQPRGNAFYSIGKRTGGNRLRVETPYLVGVIKGTQFNVAAQDDSTTISLFEGRLEVHATDESDVVDLNAGEIATRKRGARSISVMKMDGKAPTTAPRPSSSSDNGPGGGAPGTSAPKPIRGDAGTDTGGDTLVAGGVRTDPEISATLGTGATAVAANANAGANIDVRANSLDVKADVGADVAGNNANVAAGVNVGASGVAAAVTVNVATPVAAIDTSLNAGVGASGVAASANLGVSTPVASVDVAAGVNVGSSGVAVNTGAAVNVAPIATDVATTTNVSVTPAAADLTTNTAVGAGPIAANVGATAAVDLGTHGVSTAVDTGTNVAIGTTPVVNTTTNVTADIGTTTAAAVNTNTTVVGVDTGVAAAVNATSGTVDLGLHVVGVNVNANVDLGTTNSASTTTTTSTTTPATPTPPVIDVGGLLDGLVRRRTK